MPRRCNHQKITREPIPRVPITRVPITRVLILIEGWSNKENNSTYMLVIIVGMQRKKV